MSKTGRAGALTYRYGGPLRERNRVCLLCFLGPNCSAVPTADDVG